MELFSSSVPGSFLTDGFEKIAVTEVKYDPYVLQDEWDKVHPDFFGYNCRITAFSLLADTAAIEAMLERDEVFLFMDLESLSQRPLFSEQETDRFNTLYSRIGTENSKDVNVHLQKLQAAFRERGISFSESGGASWIFVVFHDQISEDENELYIGHAGVLLRRDNCCWFLEKVAFQEPYRLIKFADREGLSDYLMQKYDVDQTGTTASLFILEKDRLLDGYRENANK